MKKVLKHTAMPDENSCLCRVESFPVPEFREGESRSSVGGMDYHIVWLLNGEGTCSIDMTHYPIKANTFYFIPGGRHQFFQAQGKLSGYYFSFNRSFLALATEGVSRSFFMEMHGYFSKPGAQTLKSEQAALLSIAQLMSGECGSAPGSSLEILGGLFKVFLTCLKKYAGLSTKATASLHKRQLVESFYSKLDVQFKTKKQVAYYASELSVTPNYLTDVVKKVTGFSASYHIQQRMLEEAKRMVVFSNANMKSVAYSLGFEDLSHFSKFFKNAAGINFTDFKKGTYLIC